MADRVEQILSEMLRWIRASSHETVNAALTREFRKDGKLDKLKAKVYQMSDGQTMAVAISKATKVAQPTISLYWKRWRQLGLAEAGGDGGRQTRRCFSLEDFGLAPDDE